MEYFEEAGPENEAQVIAELGTPKEAAHEVISRLLDEKIVEDKSSSVSYTHLTTKEEYQKCVNVVVEYINQHLGEDIDLKSLARISNQCLLPNVG